MQNTGGKKRFDQDKIVNSKSAVVNQDAYIAEENLLGKRDVRDRFKMISRVSKTIRLRADTDSKFDTSKILKGHNPERKTIFLNQWCVFFYTNKVE